LFAGYVSPNLDDFMLQKNIYIYIYELVSAKKKQAARFRGEKKIKKLIKLKKQ